VVLGDRLPPLCAGVGNSAVDGGTLVEDQLPGDRRFFEEAVVHREVVASVQRGQDVVGGRECAEQPVTDEGGHAEIACESVGEGGLAGAGQARQDDYLDAHALDRPTADPVV